MKTKKLEKILSILVIAIIIISLCSNAFAVTNPNKLKGSETTSFDGLGNTIIGAVQAIGSIFAVVMLVVLGIKYMMGSAEEKAEYKKTMIPYVIGAVLVFAASNIAGFVFNFANTVK